VSVVVVLALGATSGDAAARGRAVGPNFEATVRACLGKGKIGPYAIDSRYASIFGDLAPPGVVAQYMLTGGPPWNPGQIHVGDGFIFLFRSSDLAESGASQLVGEYIWGKVPASLQKRLKQEPLQIRLILQGLAAAHRPPTQTAARGLGRVFRNVVLIWDYPATNLAGANRFMQACFTA
jgi:hypothetical protein